MMFSPKNLVLLLCTILLQVQGQATSNFDLPTLTAIDLGTTTAPPAPVRTSPPPPSKTIVQVITIINVIPTTSPVKSSTTATTTTTTSTTLPPALVINALPTSSVSAPASSNTPLSNINTVTGNPSSDATTTSGESSTVIIIVISLVLAFILLLSCGVAGLWFLYRYKATTALNGNTSEGRGRRSQYQGGKASFSNNSSRNGGGSRKSAYFDEYSSSSSHTAYTNRSRGSIHGGTHSSSHHSMPASSIITHQRIQQQQQEVQRPPQIYTNYHHDQSYEGQHSFSPGPSSPYDNSFSPTHYQPGQQTENNSYYTYNIDDQHHFQQVQYPEPFYQTASSSSSPLPSPSPGGSISQTPITPPPPRMLVTPPSMDFEKFIMSV